MLDRSLSRSVRVALARRPHTSAAVRLEIAASSTSPSWLAHRSLYTKCAGPGDVVRVELRPLSPRVYIHKPEQSGTAANVGHDERGGW